VKIVICMNSEFMNVHPAHLVSYRTLLKACLLSIFFIRKHVKIAIWMNSAFMNVHPTHLVPLPICLIHTVFSLLYDNNFNNFLQLG